MKRITKLLACVGLILSLPQINAPVQAQTDDSVIIEVDGTPIRVSQFMKEFNTNVGNQLASKQNVSEAEKRAALEEYVDLYALFRAKELDAHNLGFDTMPQLKRELGKYRKELAAPYLIDSAMLKHLMAEAYERNHTSLRVAHILVPVRNDAPAADTLQAYNRILELRKRIVEGGEDFHTVASEVIHSINPQAPQRPLEGDLGYFSVFDMVYPFENAAYALKEGEVSQPVRTQYGYHLLKLLDRVDGLYGELTLAHIWLHSTDSAMRRPDITSIYDRLKKGVPFDSLARLSDDRSTSENGGLLRNAMLSQLPPEYIHVIVDMNEGEISKPFFTQYGWHIVKMVSRDTLPPLQSLEGFYKQRMTRDQRGSASRKNFAATSRAKYGIIDCTKTPVQQPKGKKGKKLKEPEQMMASLDYLTSKLNDSVLLGIWKFDEKAYTDTTPLVIAPNKKYTALDVARFIDRYQARTSAWITMDFYARSCYDNFLDSIAIAYADSQLENEYPEFAEVVNDYRRGLMIFNYNDEMIWSKALRDTAGFRRFYARESVTKRLDNPDDSIYFFHPRARVAIFTVADSAALSPDKAEKIIAKAEKNQKGSNEMKEMLLKKIDRKKYPADNLVEYDIQLVEQTRQQLLTPDRWHIGVYTQPKGNGYRILAVEEILPRSIKDLKSARGYYLNTWQNEVEKELNEQLRQKYNVKIHRDVVRKINY